MSLDSSVPFGVPCMDRAEYSRWLEANSASAVRGCRADTPCRDCTLAFAAAMSALERCSGRPSRAGRPRLSGTPAQERRRAQWRAYKARGRGEETG